MKIRTHTCAATGCQHQIPSHLLMCMDHWRMVPVDLRRKVLATYRALSRAPGGDWQARLDARTDYLNAVAAAVAALAEKQTRKMNKRAEVEGELFPQPSPDMRKQLLKEEHGNNITTPGREPDQGGCNGAECTNRLCGPGATPGPASPGR